VHAGENICPLSIVVSDEWGTGELGRWGVGQKLQCSNNLLEKGGRKE